MSSRKELEVVQSEQEIKVFKDGVQVYKVIRNASEMWQCFDMNGNMVGTPEIRRTTVITRIKHGK